MNDDGFIPLHNAAMGGDSVTVRMLLDHGAVIYAMDNNLMQPLLLAALKDNFSAMKALVAAGADINYMNENKWTALRVAQWKKQQRSIDYLKAHGARE